MFFLSGGCLGVLFALVFEMIEDVAWSRLSPHCNMNVMPTTPECSALSATMWILTPGLIEETGKALWLFFRFRRSVDQLPGRCCLGIFPAGHSYDCGCWYKLAPTPYHVVLCALASGAGFECLENIKYVFMNTNAVQMLGTQHGSDLVTIAEMRALTSGLHMVWTGIIGWGLARRLFLPADQRPSLLCVVLPSVVMHGLYDFSLSALSWVGKSEKLGIVSEEAGTDYALLFFLFLVVSSCGSCCMLAKLTGLRFCGSRSCCCAPGFWEARFPFAKVQSHPPYVGYAVRAREIREPLISS